MTRQQPRSENEAPKPVRLRAKILIVAAVAVVVALFAILHRYADRLTGSLVAAGVEVSLDEYPIQGIDVSWHQGDINFDSVAASGLEFVYIRSTFGIMRDTMYAQNLERARAAGLKVGAYHFFHMDKDGAEQAANLMAAAGDTPLDMPVAIDLEESFRLIDPVRRSTVIGRLRDMIAALESRGHRVMIYTNKNCYRKYIKDNFPDVELWIAAYDHPSGVPREIGWTMQQYSMRGRVPGVRGDVDLDLFRGDRAQWDQWTAGGGVNIEKNGTFAVTRGGSAAQNYGIAKK